MNDRKEMIEGHFEYSRLEKWKVRLQDFSFFPPYTAVGTAQRLKWMQLTVQFPFLLHKKYVMFENMDAFQLSLPIILYMRSIHRRYR